MKFSDGIDGGSMPTSSWDTRSKIMSACPSNTDVHKVLQASWIDSPLGPMLAIADQHALYFLEFADMRRLEPAVERLKARTQRSVIAGRPNPACQIEDELREYFAGRLLRFETPLAVLGTPFQKEVWAQIQKIRMGETTSYSEIARAIGQPSACRAVAVATGANPIAIVIPCHRIIYSNGKLGGYAGGFERKDWLLARERCTQEIV